MLDYPPLPTFIEHRRIVMDFSKMLHAVMESDPRHKHQDILRELFEMSNKIWAVFAYGLRLEHHDEYYDGRVDGWRGKVSAGSGQTGRRRTGAGSEYLATLSGTTYGLPLR